MFIEEALRAMFDWIRSQCNLGTRLEGDVETTGVEGRESGCRGVGGP